MLTIGILATLGVAYYLSLASENYYLKGGGGGEPPGRWFGGMARGLGLTGQIVPDYLRELWKGFHHKTGEKLVQNAGKKDGKRKRRPGWDLTFSAPKDVSCFVATSIWKSVQPIHDEAVRDTLELLEETRAFVRRGSSTLKNIRFESALLIAALFNHLLSRAGDPTLHTHALLLNTAMTKDGKFGALHSPPFFGKRQRHFLGAYYRSHLAYNLREQLQLEARRKGTSFSIEGMSESLVDVRSKRTKQIDAYKKKEGITGGAKAKEATLATRRKKQDIPPREELYERWAKENKEYGLTERAIRKMRRAKPRNAEKDLPKLLARSVKNLYQMGVSHFTEIDFQIEALQESVNWGVHPKRVLDAVAEHIKASDHILSLGTHDKEERFATKAILERERRLLTNVDVLCNTSGLIIDLRIVKRVLRKYRLTEEQRRAVEYLTRSPGCIRLLDGRAGTGKTSVVLKACKEIWELHGYRVIGAAYTGKAAIELEEATGIPTDTIHWQLADFKRKFGFNFRHHLKQLSRAARKKRTYRLRELKPVKIDRKTILVVDESSMANTRHWEMLTELVRLGGGAMIAVGDGRQLPPVEGQSPFHSLCGRIGCARLKDIIRQKEKWAQKAATLMSEGETGKALAMYAERGLVNVAEDMDDALMTLVRDWTVQGVRWPERAPILVSTNMEAETTNDLCQQARLKAGVLGGKSAEIVDEDEGRDLTYCSRVYQGDRVVFTRNDRQLDVRNGFTGTVIGVNRFGRSISVQLDGGRRVIIPIKEYKHLRRGYGLTVHKAQAGTYPECWVLAGPHQDLPSAYVELSRSVLATHVYTSKDLLDERLQNVEDSPLAEKMSEKPDLRLATDLLEGVQLEESDDQAVDQKELTPLPEKAKQWWDAKEQEPKPEQSVPWWEREGKPAPKLVREVAARQERKRLGQEHAKKRAALARTKRERQEREQEEQRRYASGQWEREKVKRQQAAARAALEKVMRECAEREREERRQYAAAQVEADRRRKALLTQMFLVTSSVTEPRRTQAGNRDLLNSSLTAMFSLKDAEAITQTQTVNPIAGYFLAELFTPPKKEEPLTLDVEVVSAEEGASGHATPAQTIGVDAEQPECADDRVSQSNSQSAVYANTNNFSTSQSSCSSFDSSSSPTPDYTSSSVSTYQSPVSAYTETQIQSMQMAAYQTMGAAQTAISQQANQTRTYTTNRDT